MFLVRSNRLLVEIATRLFGSVKKSRVAAPILGRPFFFVSGMPCLSCMYALCGAAATLCSAIDPCPLMFCAFLFPVKTLSLSPLARGSQWPEAAQLTRYGSISI